MEDKMNDPKEQKYAHLLGDLLDGAAADIPEAFDDDLRDALEAANMISAGAGNAPEMRADFDRDLRAKLVAQAGAAAAAHTGAKVVPLTRRHWFKAALAAAMLFIILAPSWVYMKQKEYGEQTRISATQKHRLEKYDRMYEPRIDRLREQLDQGESNDLLKKYMENKQDSRKARIDRIKSRWQKNRRETGSGGNET